MVSLHPILDMKELEEITEKELREIFRSSVAQYENEVGDNSSGVNEIEEMFVQHPLAFLTLLNSTACDPVPFWHLRNDLVSGINGAYLNNRRRREP